jgi:hypothetical protein
VIRDEPGDGGALTQLTGLGFRSVADRSSSTKPVLLGCQREARESGRGLSGQP